MSASDFTIATTVMFAALGLVALGLGLLARRYSAAALGVGLTGLLATTAAATWITTSGITTTGITPPPATQAPVPTSPPVAAPEGGSAQHGREIAELKATISELESEISRERRRQAETVPRPEHEAELARYAQALKLSENARIKAESAAGEAEKKAAEATKQHEATRGALRRTQQDHADAEKRIASLDSALRAAKSPPPPPPPPAPDVDVILRKLTEGNPGFYTSRHERALIPGRRGIWRVVSLLPKGQPLTFADRAFVHDEADGVMRSVVKFRDDVLRPLTEKKRGWALYVRGSADQRQVTGPARRELSYLPRNPDGTYAQSPHGRWISSSFDNDDLPLLRADWLRGIVRSVVGVEDAGEIAILDNPPRPTHERTAELVVFVAE